jgi:hypothetical protein
MEEKKKNTMVKMGFNSTGGGGKANDAADDKKKPGF